jgi:hypothetical protein
MREGRARQKAIPPGVESAREGPRAPTRKAKEEEPRRGRRALPVQSSREILEVEMEEGREAR